jgi:predicted nuclease of predicted toxin-antitoxin system
MTLLIDENLPRYWVAFLAASGFSAIHWTEIGAVGAADDEIFAYAETHHGVVIIRWTP